MMGDASSSSSNSSSSNSSSSNSSSSSSSSNESSNSSSRLTEVHVASVVFLAVSAHAARHRELSVEVTQAAELPSSLLQQQQQASSSSSSDSSSSSTTSIRSIMEQTLQLRRSLDAELQALGIYCVTSEAAEAAAKGLEPVLTLAAWSGESPLLLIFKAASDQARCMQRMQRPPALCYRCSTSSSSNNSSTSSSSSALQLQPVALRVKSL
ncbi:hypothetical protein Efla_002699 [Eimeria flavescens]